jgi:hypothetical protein
VGRGWLNLTIMFDQEHAAYLREYDRPEPSRI